MLQHSDKQLIRNENKKKETKEYRACIAPMLYLCVAHVCVFVHAFVLQAKRLKKKK
jgi:hypothetical protein